MCTDPGRDQVGAGEAQCLNRGEQAVGHRYRAGFAALGEGALTVPHGGVDVDGAGSEVEVLRAYCDNLAEAETGVSGEQDDGEAGRADLGSGIDELLKVVGLEVFDLAGRGGP